jgi:hypothetical protein
MRVAVLALVALALAGGPADPPPAAGPSKTFRFTNGKWFDGREFVPRFRNALAADVDEWPSRKWASPSRLKSCERRE